MGGTGGMGGMGGVSSSGDGDGAMAMRTPAFPTTRLRFDDGETAGKTTVSVKQGDSTRSDAESLTYPFDPRVPEALSEDSAEIQIRSYCQTSEHRFTNNAFTKATYGLSEGELWPGALLEGADYADGALRPIEIAGKDRAGFTLRIAEVEGGGDEEQERFVSEPTPKKVEEALARMLEEYEDDLEAASRIDVEVLESRNLGRLWAELSTTGPKSSGALAEVLSDDPSQRVFLVHISQPLFELEVLPPAPSTDAPSQLRETLRWVTSAFVDDGLDRLFDEGALGQDNPPVYVHKVTYGRMLTLALASRASASDLREVISESVSALQEQRSLSSDARLSKIRDASTGAVLFRGGSRDDANQGAQDWNFRAFFESNLSLSASVPIELELRNVIDGTPAGETQVEKFEETRCMPVLTDEGPFEFGLEERHESPFKADEFTLAHSGDFNGDGITDVAWNRLSEDENSTVVAYGSPVGLQLASRDELCNRSRCTFEEPDDAQWTDFQLLTGDFDGEGRDDLLWVQTIPTSGKVQYRLMLLLADESGFDREIVEQIVEIPEPRPVDAQHAPVVGDIDANGSDDIAFGIISVEDLGANEKIHQRPHFVLSTPGDDNPFSSELFTNSAIGNTNTDKASARPGFDLQDFNGDGYLDLAWSLMGFKQSDGDRANAQHPQLQSPDADQLTFGAPGQYGYGSTGWEYYAPFYGDFDGDSDADMVFLRVDKNDSSPEISVHAQLYDQESGAFLDVPYSDWGTVGNPELLESTDVMRGYQRQIFSLAVNGDTPLDIVVTSLADETEARNDRMNVIAAMLGREAGQSLPADTAGLFETTLAPQVHPVDQDWSVFTQVLTGDFNGDELGDVLYNDPDRANRSYVAFGKRELDE